MEKVVSLPLKQHGADNKSISLDERDDDALMLMARAGVERAFDLLVRRHQRMALSVAIKYLGDSVGAEDIAQNSFVNLYRNISRYRPEGKFRAYLARIVINNCRMAKRSARSEESTRQAFRALQENDTSDEVVLYRRKQRRLLDSALLRLTPKLREVVILRYSADLCLQEIADTLGIRIGTVKSRLFAGVERLGRAVEALER